MTTTTTCRWVLAELAVAPLALCRPTGKVVGGSCCCGPLYTVLHSAQAMDCCPSCPPLAHLSTWCPPSLLPPPLFRTSLTTAAGAVPTARCRRSAPGGCWVAAGCKHSLCSACCALLAAALECLQLPGIGSSWWYSPARAWKLHPPSTHPTYYRLTYAHRYARQHYTSRAPPSHREIQAALVQIGDKEPSFIGSK